MTDENLRFIDSLKTAIAWLEANGELIPRINASLSILLVAEDKETVAAVARAMHGARKTYSDEGTAYLDKQFGNGVQLSVCFPRNLVCRKVVKGTKVIPAEPEKTIEDVEWVCDEPILASPASPSV